MTEPTYLVCSGFTREVPEIIVENKDMSCLKSLNILHDQHVMLLWYN